MGLFDRFGVGGGRLAIQPQSPHAVAGGVLAGVVAFQGGSRSQRITAITLRLAIEQQVQEATPQGQRQTTRAEDVVRLHPISSAFESAPNSVQQFPFSVQLPTGLPSSMPGAVVYRLYASADIDDEIDPGATCEIQVVGAQAQAASMGMPGQMMQPPMPPQPMGVPQIGQDVMAQYGDGSMRPARVVAMQNGMVGVDWHDPALGQSSWVYPQQVQPMHAGGVPAAMSPQQASAVKAQMNAQYAQQQQAAQHDPAWEKQQAMQKQLAMQKQQAMQQQQPQKMPPGPKKGQK